jgi:nicotinamide/nicotinate riboside kinase
MKECFVVRISGPSCSGKTSLATRLQENLKNSVLIRQDDYFLPEGDPRHTQIAELNHHNWEILSSLDMSKMHFDILKIMEEKSNEEEVCYIIIERFTIFNCKPIADLCHLKYFMLISKEECWNRRKVRVYEPPDVPGYFDKVVWPEYLRHKAEMMGNFDMQKSITFLDGTEDLEKLQEIVLEHIL